MIKETLFFFFLDKGVHCEGFACAALVPTGSDGEHALGLGLGAFWESYDRWSPIEMGHP